MNCAVAIQGALDERNAALPEAERVQLRIGISLGDVIVQGRDLYGNGVNSASRLEALAEPTAPAQERRVLLADVIERVEELSERCRSVLKLRYQSDFKPAELADHLGYSRRGIYKILDRCVAALSKRLLVTHRRRA